MFVFNFTTPNLILFLLTTTLLHALDVILQTFVFIVNFLREQSIEMSLLAKILLDGQSDTVWALSFGTVNDRLSPSVVPTLGGIRFFFSPCPIRFSQRGVPAGEWQAPDQSEHVYRGQGGDLRISDHLPFFILKAVVNLGPESTLTVPQRVHPGKPLKGRRVKRNDGLRTIPAKGGTLNVIVIHCLESDVFFIVVFIFM